MKIKLSQEWLNISRQYEAAKNISMKSLFEKDQNRFENFSIRLENILFDFSKNIITSDIFSTLLELPKAAKLKDKIDAMFDGEKINFTENRAVLHTALRQQNSSPIYVDGENIIPKIKSELAKMQLFADSIHNGIFRGITNKKITDIVNIGIGGSDLGPAMVVEALHDYAVEGITSHFVSNVDDTDILNVLKRINPETTLFVVASKTFTTQETLLNAMTAKEWLLAKLGNDTGAVAKHFVALSTNIDACAAFGIDVENIFQFWDWVGGRYSLWSAIGLSIALSVSYNNFSELLQGAFAMDEHFRTAPFDRNIPVVMALLGIWYNNFFDARSHCVVPYEQNLSKFPAFLQQLDMESNGKSIDIYGEILSCSSAPIVWGAAGTNAQHSFFQLIHQGTQMIPADFIAFAKTNRNENRANIHHDILLSNFFAQTEALMKGKTPDEARKELVKQNLSEDEINRLLPHKVFAGNKPTNTLLIKELTPKTLGNLIALYEHKVFVQGCLWEINSFDQWGVELGKQLAKKILPELETASKINSHDSSTNELINLYKLWKL